MRYVVEALIALSLANGFTASDVAARVRLSANKARHSTALATPAYDLKKLRGKQIVNRSRHTRRYETLPTGSQGADGAAYQKFPLRRLRRGRAGYGQIHR
jgi:hypothetical protein